MAPQPAEAMAGISRAVGVPEGYDLFDVTMATINMGSSHEASATGSGSRYFVSREPFSYLGPHFGGFPQN